MSELLVAAWRGAQSQGGDWPDWGRRGVFVKSGGQVISRCMAVTGSTYGADHSAFVFNGGVLDTCTLAGQVKVSGGYAANCTFTNVAESWPYIHVSSGNAANINATSAFVYVGASAGYPAVLNGGIFTGADAVALPGGTIINVQAYGGDIMVSSSGTVSATALNNAFVECMGGGSAHLWVYPFHSATVISNEGAAITYQANIGVWTSTHGAIAYQGNIFNGNAGSIQVYNGGTLTITGANTNKVQVFAGGYIWMTDATQNVTVEAGGTVEGVNNGGGSLITENATVNITLGTRIAKLHGGTIHIAGGTAASGTEIEIRGDGALTREDPTFTTLNWYTKSFTLQWYERHDDIAGDFFAFGGAHDEKSHNYSETEVEDYIEKAHITHPATYRTKGFICTDSEIPITVGTGAALDHVMVAYNGSCIVGPGGTLTNAYVMADAKNKATAGSSHKGTLVVSAGGTASGGVLTHCIYEDNITGKVTKTCDGGILRCDIGDNTKLNFTIFVKRSMFWFMEIKPPYRVAQYDRQSCCTSIGTITADTTYINGNVVTALRTTLNTQAKYKGFDYAVIMKKGDGYAGDPEAVEKYSDACYASRMTTGIPPKVDTAVSCSKYLSDMEKRLTFSIGPGGYADTNNIEVGTIVYANGGAGIVTKEPLGGIEDKPHVKVTIAEGARVEYRTSYGVYIMQENAYLASAHGYLSYNMGAGQSAHVGSEYEGPAGVLGGTVTGGGSVSVVTGGTINEFSVLGSGSVLVTSGGSANSLYMSGVSVRVGSGTKTSTIHTAKAKIDGGIVTNPIINQYASANAINCQVVGGTLSGTGDPATEPAGERGKLIAGNGAVVKGITVMRQGQLFGRSGAVISNTLYVNAGGRVHIESGCKAMGSVVVRSDPVASVYTSEVISRLQVLYGGVLIVSKYAHLAYAYNSSNGYISVETGGVINDIINDGMLRFGTSTSGFYVNGQNISIGSGGFISNAKIQHGAAATFLGTSATIEDAQVYGAISITGKGGLLTIAAVKNGGSVRVGGSDGGASALSIHVESGGKVYGGNASLAVTSICSINSITVSSGGHLSLIKNTHAYNVVSMTGATIYVKPDAGCEIHYV